MKKIILTLVIILVISGFSSAVSAVYDDWDYKIAVNMTENSGSTLTDYQVLLTIDTASLISEGKMQEDCDDIRFTDSDESTELSYWLESDCNTTNTKVWVKVPSLAAGSTKIIYRYHGNTNATSASNGTNTFEFFDDFSGSSLDTNKWDVGAGLTIDVSSGLLTIRHGTGWDGIESKGSYDLGENEIFFRLKNSGWHGTTHGGTFGFQTSATISTGFANSYYEYSIRQRENVDWESGDGYDVEAGEVFRVYRQRKEGDNYRFYREGNNVRTTSFSERTLKVVCSLYNYELIVDWVGVRKYTPLEPTLTPSPDWDYKTPINVTENSGSNLTDYQVLLTIDTASLISEGKMQSDCDDIKFTDNDESTELSYWLESGCNTSNTKLWVKVNLSASSTRTLYIYYGNTNTPSASDGTNTFEFFDDFDTDTKYQYTVAEAGSQDSYTYDSTNKRMNFNCRGRDDSIQYMAKSISVDTGILVEADWRFSSNPSSEYSNYFGTWLSHDLTKTRISSTQSGFGLYLHDDYDPGYAFEGLYVDKDNNTSTSTEEMVTPDYGTSLYTHWFHSEISYLNSTNTFTAKSWEDGITLVVNQSYSYPVDSINYFGFGDMMTSPAYGSHTSVTPGWLDNVRVRKYAPSEPTYTIGSEQQNAADSCTDNDDDGWGAAGSNLTFCNHTASYDCDDSDADINPNAYDIPNNGIDEDCSGNDASASYEAKVYFIGETGFSGLGYYIGDDVYYEVNFMKNNISSDEDVINIVVNLTDVWGNVLKSQSISDMEHPNTGNWTGIFTTHDIINQDDDKVNLKVYVYNSGGTLLDWRTHGDEWFVTGTAPLFAPTAYTYLTDALSNHTVKDLVVNSTEAKIDWSESTLDLHARNIDLDSALTIGDRSAYLDSAAYSELNDSATITFYDVNCASAFVFYSETATNRANILLENKQCLPPRCTDIECIGSTLTVTVSSFTGYAAESDANLTIDADDPKFAGAEVHFTADYRNVTDDSLISGATCTIYFTDGNYPMAEGATYTYNRTFVTEGLKDYNVTCIKAGFSTLTAFDNATIVSVEIPEFSAITLGFGLIAVLAGLFIIRKKQ